MQVASLETVQGQERAKLATVKADHIKQHKLNQKQTQDLLAKVSQAEVRIG